MKITVCTFNNFFSAAKAMNSELYDSEAESETQVQPTLETLKLIEATINKKKNNSILLFNKVRTIKFSQFLIVGCDYSF